MTEASSYEKYVEQFKKYRSRVQLYEENFQAKVGRKPSKDDLKKAPEQILVCIKNCKKIRHYFEQKGLNAPTQNCSKDETEMVVNEPISEDRKETVTREQYYKTFMPKIMEYQLWLMAAILTG